MSRFLLLDDNRAFADNLAEILRDEGHDVVVTESGEAAIEAARRTRFDALLTDMKMPGMSGAAVVHRVRRVDPHLPAVVITAFPGEDDLALARQEGLLAVMPKPVPLDALVPMLERARRDALVVLVEDDHALADNLTEVLRGHGFGAVQASTVLETDKLAAVAPFCALVDLRLPDGPDGAGLRALEARYPELPVVLITAHPDAARVAGSAEPVALFPKPFDTQRLVGELERLYQERHA